MGKEAVEKMVNEILGYHIVFKFIGRKESYYVRVKEKSYSRLWEQFQNYDSSSGVENPFWFDTVDGMSVAINPRRLQGIEMGQDLAEPQEGRITDQVLGEKNPELEEGDDDREVRLFLVGHEAPYTDFADPNDDHGLLVILYDAFSGFLDQQHFSSFDWDSGDDVRRVFFRSEDFELIEAPKKALNAYYKKSMEDAGASAEEIAKLEAGFKTEE